METLEDQYFYGFKNILVFILMSKNFDSLNHLILLKSHQTESVVIRTWPACDLKRFKFFWYKIFPRKFELYQITCRSGLWSQRSTLGGALFYTWWNICLQRNEIRIRIFAFLTKVDFCNATKTCLIMSLFGHIVHRAKTDLYSRNSIERNYTKIVVHSQKISNE